MERRLLKYMALLILLGTMTACGAARTKTPPRTEEPTASVPTDVSTEVPNLVHTAVPTEVPSPTTKPTVTPKAEPTPTESTPPPISAGFAPYVKEAVDVQPAVSHDPIAPDLSNVVSAFLLSPQQRQHLAQDGFVVSPTQEKEFYTLYEKARYNYEPIFITSDSLLHAYHLIFDKVLRTVEREQFIPALQRLNALMLQASEDQYEGLVGSSLEEHARRNVAFFAVGSRLLDPDVPIPAYAADLAETELALIYEHAGIQPSPLFPSLPYGEDYTQYIPRGHYTLGEDLEAYFRSLMWYGRMTFRIIKPEDPDGREETRRALLLVQALASNPEAVSLWEAIYEPTVFFVGRSDDLLYTEYLGVMNQVYGDSPDPAAFADEDTLTTFMEEAQKLRPPRILGMVIGPETEDVEEETKGFRFMGQRFIPDSYMFRQLIWRNVGDCMPPNRRGLPKGLDLLAVMGSERAYAILEAEGDTAFAKYVENFNRLRDEFSTLSEEEWTQNLYWSWLYTFFPLMETPGEGYPAFMRSPAWLDKSLNTVLGSWAELRHDTILYAKQVYAEAGGGGLAPPSPEPPKGYVEPVPEFYARLAALAHMTRMGLYQRGLLNTYDEGSLRKIEELALTLKAMSEKELAGRPLSEEEYWDIRFYGGELEDLTFASFDGYEGTEPDVGGEEPQAAVIADVATDPDPNCDGSSDDAVVLEEGVGRILAIYAVVPIEGELVVAKGGVFSYYEFPWPMGDRLTDEKWRDILDNGEDPAPPPWTASFRVDETEEAALRERVWDFNKAWIDAAWYPDPDGMQHVATGEALQQANDAARALVDEGAYESHHLIGIAFLSFDLQDADRAIVTTRETWWTERREMRPSPYEEGTLIATRPEYEVGFVYHLERVEGRWMVSRVLIQGTIPEWQEVSP